MRTLCLFFSFLLLSIAACGGEKERESSGAADSSEERGAMLDLKQGSFGGVGLGDTVSEMQGRFGAKDPASEGEPWTALALGSDEDYSPRVLGPEDLGPETPMLGYRYEHVVFMVIGSRIDAIIVNDPNARARDAKIGIGDDLAQARDRYRLRCGTANENTEYEPFPACTGRTASRVYVWFGADPIRNITIASFRPDGV